MWYAVLFIWHVLHGHNMLQMIYNINSIENNQRNADKYGKSEYLYEAMVTQLLR